LTLERLVERLRDFGFTRDEAEIFVFLLRAGPCPASVVARRFEISRMKAYRALKELEEKGLVHRIMGEGDHGELGEAVPKGRALA